MASAKTQILDSKKRAFAGSIITIVDLDTGREEVTHEPGFYAETGSSRPNDTASGNVWAERVVEKQSVVDGVRLFCERLEARTDGDWRVRTISTPATILADIQGRKPSPQGGIPMPELIMLSKAGFAHLAERQGTGS